MSKKIILILTLSLSIPYFSKVYAVPICVEQYEKLSEEQKTNLLKIKTKFHVKLNDILKSGRKNQDSKIGCYAGDAESYDLFRIVLDPTIKKYHMVLPKEEIDHSLKILTDKYKIENSNNIVSTRFRVARNLNSFPFPSSMSVKERIKVEKIILDAIKKLPEYYHGKYYAIGDLTPDQFQEMVEQHLIFKKDDKYLEAANILKGWPHGRGAYISDNKKFMVWINEEDHLRIIFLTKEKDIISEFNKFVIAVTSLESNLNFAKNNRLGYLNSCPTNIGSGLRASVHLKINNLSPSKLDEIAKKNHLSIRGTHGEHSKVLGNIYDISNKQRLGIKPSDIIHQLINGINSIMEAQN